MVPARWVLGAVVVMGVLLVFDLAYKGVTITTAYGAAAVLAAGSGSRRTTAATSAIALLLGVFSIVYNEEPAEGAAVRVSSLAVELAAAWWAAGAIGSLYRARDRERLAVELADAMDDAEDDAHALHLLCRGLVGRICDWAVVYVPVHREFLEPVEVVHDDPAARDALLRLLADTPVALDTPVGAGRALLDGRPHAHEVDPAVLEQALPAGRDALQQAMSLDLRHAAHVPIGVGGRPVAVLSLARRSRGFDGGDLAGLQLLAGRAGHVLERTRAHRAEAERARVLHASLMPAELHAPAGLDAAAVWRPAGGAPGGDFYDLLVTGGGVVALVGDVAGKGAQAAALTSLVRHTVRAALLDSGDPGRALALADRAMKASDLPPELFCTLVMVRLTTDGDGAALDVWSAGHPCPVLAGFGRAEPLRCFGPMIGPLHEGLGWVPSRARLERGQSVVLHTDGVTEATRQGRADGPGSVVDRAAAATAGDGARHLAEQVAALAQGPEADRRDDVCVLVLSLTDPGALSAALPALAPAVTKLLQSPETR